MASKDITSTEQQVYLEEEKKSVIQTYLKEKTFEERNHTNIYWSKT